MKQQLFKHIFKFLHYKFSLNNSWPQDFGRIKPLTKLEPIKSPYKKLDLKVDYEHQNHSLFSHKPQLNIKGPSLQAPATAPSNFLDIPQATISEQESRRF